MRRSAHGILAGLFLLIGVGLSVRVGAQAAPATRTISIATLAPPGSTWMRVFDAWNREVRRRSNKALQFRFYAGGVQGDEVEVIRKVRSGRLDGGAVTAVGLSQIHRPTLAFQIPGMFTGYDQLDRARTALDHDISAAFESSGFVHVGWGDVGRSRIFSNGPVRTPRELAGTRPWVWRDDLVLPTFFQIVSANPVGLQVPEVLSALQTNRINAVITAPAVAVQLQWSTRVTHMTDIQIASVIAAVVIGRTQWNSLPADQQAILRETGLQFMALARRNLRQDETTALRTLAEHGITVVPLDASQRAVWEGVFTQTRQRLTGQIADAAFLSRVSSAAH